MLKATAFRQNFNVIDSSTLRQVGHVIRSSTGWTGYLQLTDGDYEVCWDQPNKYQAAHFVLKYAARLTNLGCPAH